MKIYVKTFFILMLIVFWINIWLANEISLTWTTSESSPNLNFGKLVFPWSWSWVKINTSKLNLNPSDDLEISGYFWLSELSYSGDKTFWWATFDTWMANKVVLENNQDWTFTFSWFAWSKTSGWIYFWETKDSNGNPIVNWKVVYNRNTGKVNWCAFSKNIWWICINNFNLDTTWPLINIKPFVANHTKTLTFWSILNKIEVENWNDDGTMKTYSNTGSIIHDFRKAKDYTIKLTDVSWNVTSWTLKVVAWKPSNTFLTWAITWVNNASKLTNSTWDKIADNSSKHNINIELRDTYWNPIKPEDEIKDVELNIVFFNNVDMDQILNDNSWDAITYETSNFVEISDNSFSWTSSDWKYKIDIKSKAPTKEWYQYTSDNNDIYLKQINIKVKALSGTQDVWQWNFTGSSISWFNQSKFKFKPALSYMNLLNDNWFDIRWDQFVRDFRNNFNLWIKANTWWVTDIKIKNLLDVVDSSGVLSNLKMSFQDLTSINNKFLCRWYNLKNWDAFSYYSSWSIDDCESYEGDYSSVIIKEFTWSVNSWSWIRDSFSAIPKVIFTYIVNFWVKYSSFINYKLWTDIIKFPFYDKSYNNLENKQVEISWITRSSKFFSVNNESESSLDTNGMSFNFYKIKKNIEPYARSWKQEIWGIFYTWSTYEITTWPTWIDTIISDWWDIIISNNVLWDSSSVKSIVSLKKNGNWWNIYIKKDVEFIKSILVAEKSLLSWDGQWVFYSDNWSATWQLFIKWSILSNNTIGWSSLATPQCPSIIPSAACNETSSRRYDFNHFRVFTEQTIDSTDETTYGITMKDNYKTTWFIVEYDPKIQTKTPKIFLNN